MIGWRSKEHGQGPNDVVDAHYLDEQGVQLCARYKRPLVRSPWRELRAHDHRCTFCRQVLARIEHTAIARCECARCDPRPAVKAP